MTCVALWSVLNGLVLYWMQVPESWPHALAPIGILNVLLFLQASVTLAILLACVALRPGAFASVVCILLSLLLVLVTATLCWRAIASV